VLADVHEGVRREHRAQPPVRGEVVVRRGQVRVVVDRDRVLPEAPGRLHHHHDVACPQRGEDDVVAVHEQRARGGAPVLLHRLAQVAGQGLEEGPVVGGRDAHRIARQLLLGEPVRVLAAGGDECVHQCVTIQVRDARQGVRAVERADVVAMPGHRGQQADDRRGGVEPDGVADAGMLGRVGGQHHDDPPLDGRGVPQPGVGDRGAGHAGRPLGIGDVVRQSVGVGLLERERHTDQPAVELGDRDLVADVERGETVVIGRPVLA
jgi:hypothetical protein